MSEPPRDPIGTAADAYRALLGRDGVAQTQESARLVRTMTDEELDLAGPAADELSIACRTEKRRRRRGEGCVG